VRSALPGVLAALAALALVLDGATVDALQQMTGNTKGASKFGGLQVFLENLRDGLMPLTIPIGGIGLAAGGTLYMLGNQMAMRLITGVVIGIGVVLLAPTIVA
jgi:hypothetical protein